MTDPTPPARPLAEFRTRAKSDPGQSLPWPDALAITTVIAFFALLAWGAFDLMLPWIGVGR